MSGTVNLDIPKKSQDEIKDLRKEINGFKQSREFLENELQNKIQRFHEKHENISKTIDEIYDYQIVSDFSYNKLIDLEDRSRTNNLRVYGLSEAKD